MGTQVVHVEVTGKDGAKLQQFFKDVFGWSLDTNNPGGYGMYRQDDGLTGGIGAAQDGGAGWRDVLRPHRRSEGRRSRRPRRPAAGS